MSEQFERTEIPRHAKWGGPLVIPPNRKVKAGDHKCSQCGRMVAPSGRKAKGTCPCEYYQRTTTFIKAMDDQYNLSQWMKRQVAYGMSQRPDLVLAASAVRPDTDPEQTPQDKQRLQGISEDAMEAAKSRAAATTGTSLHTLTEWIDTGRELGHVPDPYPADLRAYQEATKGIEFVDVEAFRVNDEFKVAGTADRIGWYKGRLRLFDIKTGGIYGGQSPSMQLAMYARSKRYNIGTDQRVDDVAPLDLSVAYIIHLPAGKGKCELIPVDIGKGWGGCLIASQVHSFRKQEFILSSEDRMVKSGPTFFDLVAQANSMNELRIVWRKAKDQQVTMTPELREFMDRRAAELKAAAAHE